MSTSPTTVAATTAAPSTLSAFLKSHEKLLIWLLCLIFATFATSRFLGWLASRDAHNAEIAHATLAAQVTQSQTQTLAGAQAESQYKSLVAQLMASNASLSAAVANRDLATQHQTLADISMQPPQLAARWTQLLAIGPSEVTPTASGYAVSPSAATSTMAELEANPALKADLADARTMAGNSTKQIGALQSLNSGLQSQILDDGSVLSATNKSCEADKATLRAQARKGKLKWFLIGFVSGFGLGHFLHATVTL